MYSNDTCEASVMWFMLERCETAQGDAFEEILIIVHLMMDLKP